MPRDACRWFAGSCLMPGCRVGTSSHRVTLSAATCRPRQGAQHSIRRFCCRRLQKCPSNGLNRPHLSPIARLAYFGAELGSSASCQVPAENI